MKHLNVKDMQGKIKINKQSLGDLVELTRISPISTRIFLMLSAYVDKNNRIVTTVNTINYMLNTKSEVTQYGLRKLAKEGFIDLEVVKLNHEQTAELVTHNLDLYFTSGEAIWQVISRERASKVDLTGKYIRVTINSAVLTGTKEHDNRVLFKVKGNLFFDKNINENEISLSYWL